MSDAASEYHRLLLSDAGAALAQEQELRASFARRGIQFGGEPMRSFLRPHFVARADWDRLRDDGRALLELAARVARRAFDGDASRLCAYLGTPEAEVPWVALDPGAPDVVLSRLDAFLTPAGPRFIEINSDAPAGFGYGDRMAEAFAELPVFRTFAARHRVSYLPSGARLAEAVLAAWRLGGGSGVPRVAIVDFEDVKTRPDQEILCQTFLALGAGCQLADPRALRLQGGRLQGPEGPVDVVYRRAVLSELLERGDEVAGFLHAYREGAALFVNSLRCRLSEDKAFFALLTDEAFAHLMSAEERELVLRVVPWTRKLEERRTLHQGRAVDLIPFVLAERERLVIKPAHGYGGQSVFVGDETAPKDWEHVLGEGLGRPWVVQQRVAIPEEPFPVCEGGRLSFVPLKVNANPFYVRGAEAGAVTRASRSSVINVSAGGGSVPTFVVE